MTVFKRPLPTIREVKKLKIIKSFGLDNLQSGQLSTGSGPNQGPRA